jgi:glycerate dehydrogenase
MNIVYLDAFPIGPSEVDLSIFNDLGNFISYDRTPDNFILERAKNAEIILTNKIKFTKETLSQLPKLKYIGVTATGYNIIDTEAAKDLGITVTNAKNYSSMSVAQQTFAMILAFTNRLAEHSDNKKWMASPDFCYYDFTISELQNKTLGLVGYGDIAQKVAQIALAFEMKVLIFKRTKEEILPANITQVDLDKLLTDSDFVSLHCPLTPENEGFINGQSISKMKSSAVIINTARGGLINENQLAEALNSQIIAGAYLDVLCEEPPKKDNLLLTAKNCKISPHIAWATIEARRKLLQIVFENLKNYKNGKPTNVVN